MKVICNNDKNRPNEVPMNRWVKKDVEYTIRSICFLTIQNLYGCKLEEINNDDLFPYTFFALDRFGISQSEIVSLVEENDLVLEEI